MTPPTPDTRAAWKRRALRAEAELEALRKIRAVEGPQVMTLARSAAFRGVALREIKEILSELEGTNP